MDSVGRNLRTQKSKRVVVLTVLPVVLLPYCSTVKLEYHRSQTECFTLNY